MYVCAFQMVEHCVFEAKQKDRFTCFSLVVAVWFGTAAGAEAAVVHY